MRMDNKRRDAIVQSFNSRWKYRYDKDQYGMTDAWKIIYTPDIEGNYVGDCEDYALSILYRLCDESHIKMWWLLITHQAGICLVGRKNKWKASHAVLRYKGEYVDNRTKKFGPKSEIEKSHHFHVFYGYGWAHMTALKMLISKIVRTIKVK